MNCTCAHADPVQCAMIKHKAAATLIAVLDATCKCSCHYSSIGGLVPRGEWQEQKEAQQRRREVHHATQ